MDISQQKVTVTGNVEVETLIKKLTKKTAKHVELWPDPKSNSKDKKQSNPQSKEKQSDQAEISQEPNQGGRGGGGDVKKGKETAKVEVVEVQESGVGSKKNFEVGSSSNSKNVEGGNIVKPHEGGGGGKLKEAQTGNLLGPEGGTGIFIFFLKKKVEY